MSVIKSHIRKLSPYKPPLEGRDPAKNLLLDFNEKTTSVSTTVKEALIDYINSDKLQVYPEYSNLTDQIAEYARVASEQLMLTNGSDQGIDLIIRACCPSGTKAIIPNPSFAIYYQSALVENLELIQPWYTKDKGFPFQEVLSAIDESVSLIVIPNPNNPTGTSVEVQKILELAERAPKAAILIDECYFEYTKLSATDYIGQLKNLFVTRTFSKTWGLPSLRLGYLVSSKENIEDLLKVRGPYDVNKLAAVAVGAALKDVNYVESYVDEVLNKSKPMLENYLESKSIDFWPSVANFLFCFSEKNQEILRALQSAGILVRPKKDAAGNSGLRITLGTEEQTKRLISILETVL